MAHQLPARSTRRSATWVALVAVAILGAGALAGCGSSSAHDSKTIVVATHDSWAMPKKVIAAFEKRSGYTVRIQQQGDAGELTNKLVLTKDSPIADVVYGIDNTFASRAVDAGILQKYVATDLPAAAKKYALAGDAGAQLTPVDYSDVCVNVDDRWFADHKLAEPKTLDDLTKPAYKNLLVTPAATTSSPGLAFLIATISAKGAGWTGYWKQLLANGAKIDPGWSEAWEGDYTDGGGGGKRPIVVSYSSSPPDTIAKGATRPRTSVLLDTCFRQVEFAGVIDGADNTAGAKAFVDFLVSRAAQETLPENMYVYPVNPAAKVPADWAKWAPAATKPWPMDAATITAKRTDWLRQWRDLVTG